MYAKYVTFNSLIWILKKEITYERYQKTGNRVGEKAHDLKKKNKFDRELMTILMKQRLKENFCI